MLVPSIKSVIRVSVISVSVLLSSLTQAQSAIGPEQVEADSVGTLAKGWSSFFDHEPMSAAGAVEKLTRSPNLGTKLHALHVKARSLWLAGDPISQKTAQAIWAQLARDSQGEPFFMARTEIARGLGLSQAGENANAIEAIEQVAKKDLPSAVDIEAAIALAMLYAQADRVQDATAALDEADKILGYPEKISLPPEFQKAFATGVKQARESIANKGRALFELARGIQREKQFPRAITLFNQVTKDFPDSDFAPRSQFEVGSCLASMGRQDEAIEHWQTFVAAAPAGPWRGQAYSRLIDIQLTERLDLAEAEGYAMQAKTSLAAARGQALGAAKGGWDQATFGLGLRIGMVAFCSENRVGAAEAFDQARGTTTDKSASEQLDALLALARGTQVVIPDDCRSTASPRDSDSGRVSLALTLGMLHHVAGVEDSALTCFSRVTGSPPIPAAKGSPAKPGRRPLSGATPAQLAFALFGKGIVLEPLKNNKEARDAFLLSWKTAKDGSWQDETLYRLASLIEADADTRFAKGERGTAEQIAAMRTERAKALPFWQQILAQFPKSPRAEWALYRIGVLAYEGGESASVAASAGGAVNAETTKQVEKAWENAAKSLAAFTDAYPESEHAGDAYVRQIDLAVERLFDLDRANTLGPLAAKWAKAAAQLPNVRQIPPWVRSPSRVPDSVLVATRRDCLMLAGLAAYLAERYDEAVDCINSAGPQPPQAGFTARPDLEAIGLDYLRRAILERKPVTDPRALEAAINDPQRMAMQLGDLYLESIRPERAEAVFLRIIEKEPHLGKVPAAVEAYAMIQVADALDRIRGRREEALGWLSQLVERKDLIGSHWHGLGMFRLALFTFNQKQDSRLAIPLYQAMLRRYPDHEVAELAAAYLCFCTIRIKDGPLARRLAKEFSSRYPQSNLIPVIEERIRERLPAEP